MTKAAALGLLIFVVIVIIISHIAERDWRDKLNNWRE